MYTLKPLNTNYFCINFHSSYYPNYTKFVFLVLPVCLLSVCVCVCGKGGRDRIQSKFYFYTTQERPSQVYILSIIIIIIDSCVVPA